MIATSELLDAIRAHGRDAYPEEGCGFLLGEITPEGNRVTAIRRVENGDAVGRERHYTIAPADYLAADREAARHGLDLVGVYHSHPDHPARPSATDLAEATFPGFTYVIVAIHGGVAADLTAWTLAPDRSHFAPETVRVVEAVAAAD